MFIDKEHSQFLLKGLSLLRQNEELCDVELKIGEISVFAHKVVLAAISDYFKAMFTGRMEESFIRTVNLHDTDPKSIAMLVDFAYTGHISLTVNNVQSLLVTSNMLGVSKVVNACCDFLKNQLHPSNCLGFFDFAEIHCLSLLKSSCLEFVLEHFVKVMHYEEYLSSSSKVIKQILVSDDINIIKEEHVYMFLEQWALHAPKDRMNDFYKLLLHIRLSLVSTNFINSLKLKSFFSCPEGYPFLLKLNLTLNVKENPYRLLDHDLIKDGCRRRSSNHLMVIGGKGGLLQALESCSLYDAEKNMWKPCKPLHYPRVDASSATLHDKIYVTGGMTYTYANQQSSQPVQRHCTASVLSYCHHSDSWTYVPEMNKQRSSHHCVSHGGLLYAIGGYNGQACLKSAECFDPKTKKWTTIADMKYSRSSFAAVTLEEFIYVLGGQGTAHLCTVERYDTKLGKWEMMPAMSTKRINFGAAQLHGFIFVVGGHDGQDYLRSMERFDTVLSEWSVVSPLSSPRTGIGIAVVQNQIFVLGGHDGNRYLNSVDRYDPREDTWSKASDMINPRCYMSVSDVWI